MKALLLVDHGSRAAAANAQLEALADELRARWPDRFVATAHLEIEPPDLAAGLDACAAAGAHEVVVHPFFLAPGRHGSRDVPEQAAAWAERHPELVVRVSAPLGLHPSLVDAVVGRIDEVSADAGPSHRE